MNLQETIEAVGEVIDALGVAAIVIGILAATLIAAWRLLSRQPDTYRHSAGSSAGRSCSDWRSSWRRTSSRRSR